MEEKRDYLEEAVAREIAGMQTAWARDMVVRLMKDDPDLEREIDEMTVRIYARLLEKGQAYLRKKYGGNGRARSRRGR